MRDQILHNPRCSKSRATLALLDDHDAQVEVVRYLDTPPTTDTLDAICRALDVEPTAIVRTKEALFGELGLSLDDARSRDAWLKLLVANPRLIERPIVVIGGRAVIGRPPENVLALLDG